MVPKDTPRWRQRLTLAAVIVVLTIVVFLAAREIISLKDRFTLARTVPVKSPVDGMTYAVHDDYPDAAAAADMLARINQRVIEIMRHLKKEYIKNAAPDLVLQYPERVKAVARLLARYNPDNLAENSPYDPEGDTAFSLDKGSLIALCLRDRPARKGQKTTDKHDEGTLHSIDTILFVMIHEMAHVAVDVVDHPYEFWSAFKFLLMEAEKGGIAQFPDYRLNPVNYCGILVNYNPMQDPRQAIIR